MRAKPIMIVTVPAGLNTTAEQIKANLKSLDGYHVVVLVDDPCRPIRERVRIELRNTGFWDRLFNYLDQRKQRLHDREVDDYRNKLHRLTEKCERLAKERDFFRVMAETKANPVVTLSDADHYGKTESRAAMPHGSADRVPGTPM